MAKRYFPFDAGAGAVVTETEWAEMAPLWRPTGVVAGLLDELEVSADGTDMTVDVATGVAWVQGFYFDSDAIETLAISAADPFEARIDRVVVELDRAGNVVDLVVLEGTPDPDPASAMASLTQDDVTWHVERARVTVPANATEIAPGNVDNVGDLVATPIFAAGGDNPAEAEGRAWVRTAGGAYVPVDVVTAAEHTLAAHDSLGLVTDAEHTKALHDGLGIDAETLDGLDSLAFLLHSLADAAGDLLVADAADSFARLAKGAEGEVLKISGGVPAWGASGGAHIEAKYLTGFVSTEQSVSWTTAFSTTPVVVAEGDNEGFGSNTASRDVAPSSKSTTAASIWKNGGGSSSNHNVNVIAMEPN